MVTLLIIGLAVLASGLLTLAYGIPIKDFSFGNTLIIAGTVAACSGLLLLGLAMVVRQLRRIAEGIEALPLSSGGPTLAPAPGEGGRRPGRRHDGLEPVIAPPPRPPAPEPAPELRPEPRLEAPPAPEPAVEPAPAAPSSAAPAASARRNLLFVSSRRERATASGLPPTGAYSELTPPALAPEPPSPAAPAAPAPAAPAPVTVVKSGSVDGMAYSLYSDGSIEAQLPEGMMRFASIDDLRAHLEHKP